MSNRASISSILSGEGNWLFINDDAIHGLKQIPDKTVDCVITSPPYWLQRVYENDNGEMNVIGNEADPNEYISHLREVFQEIYRILKDDGAFWLNIGDKYYDKKLMLMPARVALAMEADGWILRNDIIWDKMKGTQSAKDRFRDIHEHLYLFVKSPKYYFNADAIRIQPRKKPIIDEKITISATGVSGKKYFKMIETSPVLTNTEKQNAKDALNQMLQNVRDGKINDFRMIIRGQQRISHSNNTKVSGRAKELQENGYYFLKVESKGFLPTDIWRIVPEDVWKKDEHHSAVFPEELLRIPILSTSHSNGIVLDPFSGTGSTVACAVKYGRRGIGIDISDMYTETANKRLETYTKGEKATNILPLSEFIACKCEKCDANE